MGEAKRRMDLGPNGHKASINSPEIQTLLEKGQPINVHLFGSIYIIGLVRALSFEEFMIPERHALRLAFQMLDRIRTGEIGSWPCFFCRTELAGLGAVSVMTVIERALGDPVPGKPGIVAPICHACDGVSSDETKRRVMAAFRLLPVQTGHA